MGTNVSILDAARARFAEKAMVGRFAELAVNMLELIEQKKRSAKMVGKMMDALELFKANQLSTVSYLYVKEEEMAPYSEREIAIRPPVSEETMKQRRRRLKRKIATQGEKRICLAISQRLFRDVRVTTALRVLFDLGYEQPLSVQNLGKLLTQEPLDLRKLRNVGVLTVAKIQSVLEKEGLRLGMPTEEIAMLFKGAQVPS